MAHSQTTTITTTTTQERMTALYSSLVVTALVLVTIPCGTHDKTNGRLQGVGGVDAFVPQRYNEYERYHRRIADTQLHYVKVDDTSGLEELMDVTAILRESIRVRERNSLLTETRHVVVPERDDEGKSDDDERHSSMIMSSSIHDMASFIVSRFSTTTSTSSTTIPRSPTIAGAELDPIKVMRAAGTFVPETFTLPSSLTMPLSLVSSNDENTMQVSIQMEEQVPPMVTTNSGASSTVETASSFSSTVSSSSSSALPTPSMKVMDVQLPFFVKRQQPSPSPRVPFFANVIIESKYDVMTIDTTGEEMKAKNIANRPQIMADHPANIVLAWPTLLRPSTTVQQALDNVQEAFGAMVSTTASTMVHSLSTLAQDYYDAATTGIALPQPPPPPAPAASAAQEWSIKITTALEEATLSYGAVVGHVVASISKLLSSDVGPPMGPFVRPQPPKSTPSLALFVEHQHDDDQEQILSTITTATTVTGKQELDLEEIDSVLMEAEWALKFAEAAFQ
jgi:hypothetical protein